MLTPSELSTWLSGLGLSVPVMPGPLPTGREPVTPDVIAVVIPSGSAAPVLDGTFDCPQFQVTIRGPQRRTYSENSFKAAWEADRLIRFGPLPGYIGSTWVTSVVRTGSGPTLIVPYPDPAERITYVCTYLFTASVL